MALLTELAGLPLPDDVLADPDHPEHDQLVEWAPAGLDPAAFSVSAADEALAWARE